MDTLDMKNDLIIDFKDYIESNSKYSPLVSVNPSGNFFPKVIIQFTDDIETYRSIMSMDIHSQWTITIDIYTEQQGQTSNYTIARELEYLVREYMGNIRGFHRITDTPTPNYDTNVYRITLEYQPRVDEKRLRFF